MRDELEGEAPSVRVLVVDDEESMRHFVSRALTRAGFRVETASGGPEGLQALERGSFDVLVTDLAMPRLDGRELFRRAAEVSPGTATVIMTAHGTIADAVQALHEGVESYLAKPFERDALVATVEKAGEKARLVRENRRLRERLLTEGPLGPLVGRSESLRALKEGLLVAAAAEGPVLVDGASGTGKGLVARAIHRASSRAEAPFVTVHCGALAAGLVEAELFGVRAGAFTGADEDRAGYVERSEGGTLFLDEIAELPAPSQASLLRFLQEHTYERVGDGESRRADVRVIASSQRDLRALVRTGQFRADLFYRLDVHRLHAPALAERTDDLPLLLAHFLTQCDREDLVFSEEARRALAGRSWPGNVRELRNLVERLAATHPGPRVEVRDLPDDESAPAPPRPDLRAPYREALQAFERDYLERLLRETEGNVSEAARLGGIARPTLHARLKALGIATERFRPGSR